MAAQCGYTQYVKEHYTLEELGEIYRDTFDSYGEIYLPAKEAYARKLFFQFYDHFLNDILAETQTVFPDLSMEVRLDVDPVRRLDGTLEGAPHDATFSCGSSGFASAMFSVPMGFENNGEKVTAAQALSNAASYFDRLFQSSQQKKIYIDQFLFTDNTPGFEHNAQLLETEKAAYLDGMAELFKAKTLGYGIWTYRDYGDNKVYNSQFALAQQGWKFSGRSKVEEHNGSRMAVLPVSGWISQDIHNRSAGMEENNLYVSFLLEGEGNCRVMVQAGGQKQTVSAGSPQTVTLNFGTASAGELVISAQGTGTVYIDDVKVYTGITQGDMYHMDGTESSCIQAVRAMNAKVR